MAYIRHFIFAGCYDNDPWYLVVHLAGHLDLAGHLELAGHYFSKCPANSKCPAQFVTLCPGARHYALYRFTLISNMF